MEEEQRLAPASRPSTGDRSPPPLGTEEARRAAPADRCVVCWRDELVLRDGVWWAEHVGPLDECTHSCHTESGFLDSTS